MTSQTSFVTTLGGQPQIATVMLDLLLARKIDIHNVVVIYFASKPRYFQSFLKVAEEFVGDRYGDRTIHLRGITVQFGKEQLADVFQPEQVEAVRETINALFVDLKSKSHIIHLGLAGGRRILALVALTSAMQYLKPSDHIYHLYTPDTVFEKIKDGKKMHVLPDWGVELVDVPFVPWVSYIPGLETLFEKNSQELLSARYGWLNDQERALCQNVWDALSPRRRDVMRCLAKGLSRQEIAAELSIKVTTYDTHRDDILNECEKVWHKAGLEFFERYWQELFAPFLKGLDPV